MLYLDNRTIYSYNYNTVIIIGARGIGKSFNTKKKFLKDFFYKKKKFIWVRATDSQVDELKADNGYKFIEDIINAKVFKFDFDFKIEGDNSMWICHNPKADKKSWVRCGYIMSLSTFHKMKGNAFSDIDNICVDEFIPEKTEVIRGDRARQFVNTIQTIGRLRKNYRIVLLANALETGDPILNLFFDDIKEYGIYVNRKKKAILLYAENSEEFDIATKESISGLIIADTAYENEINKNLFNSYDNLLFTHKPSGAKMVYGLENDVYKVCLFLKDNKVYVENMKNYKPKLIYARKIDLMSQEAMLISSEMLTKLRELYSAKYIVFENNRARKIFTDFIK